MQKEQKVVEMNQVGNELQEEVMSHWAGTDRFWDRPVGSVGTGPPAEGAEPKGQLTRFLKIIRV